MEMDSPDKDGITLRKRKIGIAKRKDIDIEFKDSFIDYPYRFLYHLFDELFDSREGITLQKLYYYEKLTGIKLEGFERKYLKRLSNEALGYLIKKQPKK